MPDGHIILVTGQNSVGKTTTFKILAREAKRRHLPYRPEPFSDLLFMLNNLKMDDKQGGFNHYHEWTAQKEGGHNHQKGEAELPFTVTSNKIVDSMFRDFFTALCSTSADQLVIVEWAGGQNTNPPSEPASRADFSFGRIGGMIKEGTLPSAWLYRVRMVIHLTTDTETRHRLNERKHATTLKEVKTAQLSPRKSSTVLDIFGEDDFFRIESFFRKRGIPICTIKNDGTSRFYARVQEVATQLFPLNRTETQIVELSDG